MSTQKIAASSMELNNYADELNRYIEHTSHNLYNIIVKHREVGNSWNDKLYHEFSNIISHIQKDMTLQLEELVNLRKAILEKAQILQDIEKTSF